MCVDVDMEAPRRRLTEALARGGHFQSGWMEAVFERVPRHLFAPDTVWRRNPAGPGWLPVRWAEDPDLWTEMVYSEHGVVIQLDPCGREATSVISPPAAVLNMLASLEPRPGERVLEIGTGSGYHAALLCERVGMGLVTSVEIDASLVRRAVRVLADAGYRPHVVWGDGELGWPDGAPYDRLISTSAVRRVPLAWLEQVRPGGEIVTPWYPNYHGRGLMWLRVGEDGTARGWFHGGESFMPVRGQGVTGTDPRQVWAATHSEAERFGGAAVDLSDVDEHGEFALSVLLPGVSHCRQAGDDDWFFLDAEGDTVSWARVTPGASFRHGPRDLLTDIDWALDWWRARGRPRLFDFGVTVTKDHQDVWLRTPDRIVTPPAGP
ncbi:methyltransferase domain-containing protein [Streptomyces sp. URMC 129]|uniref:methyltransferase domain-containing protein n=1 Tax=Streptomyces sp. URMC 129 TaxID=3423407 RepID=UPI003F1A87B3